MIRPTHSILVGILLAGLILRLGWGLSRSGDDQSLRALPDQLEYLQCARQWMSGHDWRFYDPRVDQWVYGSRAPGYPLFLAACGASVRLARVVQSITDISTALAAYLMARRLAQGRWALLSAGLVAFNPFLIYFSSLLLTETLFTAILAWSMYLLLERRVLGGVVLLALGVLVRPSGLLLPAMMAAAAAWSVSRPLLRVAGWAAVGVLATFIVLLPWAMRNQRVLGQWIWTTTNGGITAWDGLQPEATGASDQRFVQSMPQLRRMDELGRDAYFRALVRESIQSDPGRALRLSIPKIARTWSPIPLSETFGRPAYVMVGAAYAIPSLILAVTGFVLHLRPPTTYRRQMLLLLLPLLLLTLIHALSVGSLRYRMPLEPLLAVAAAGGAAALVSRWGYTGQ